MPSVCMPLARFAWRRVGMSVASVENGIEHAVGARGDVVAAEVLDPAPENAEVRIALRFERGIGLALVDADAVGAVVDTRLGIAGRDGVVDYEDHWRGARREAKRRREVDARVAMLV